MSTVAIICEYNPFHSGHEHQISRIREEFGAETCIVALMSGNYTQRGEIAIADKTVRARAAVEAGINLCLELPFPFSMASAELFALAGVRILNAIGTVDYLSFGSESGDIRLLQHTAELISLPEYENILTELISDADKKDGGYPKLCEMALRRLTGREGGYAPLTPNNILAIEYIRALKATKSTIKPHTIARLGSDFNESDITASEHQSATAIRAALKRGDYSALVYVPNSAKRHISEAIKSGAAPCDADAISAAVISFFRLSSPTPSEALHDVGGGLYNRIRAKSFEANTITDLVRLAETKKYTSARIRRAIWYSYFGVTSSEIKAAPAYTLLLGTDDIGRAELKRIKRTSVFPVVTKPSAFADLPQDAQIQNARSNRADSIFQLTKPTPPNGNFSLTASPYVKMHG